MIMSTLSEPVYQTSSGGLGLCTWIIPEGYLPGNGADGHDLCSHEAVCLLNTGESDAHVEISLYFADREPVGPYQVTVPARRTLHLRLNDLTVPAPIPRNTDFSSVIRSDAPVVVQHTRLDSRLPAHALMTTLAFGIPGPGSRPAEPRSELSWAISRAAAHPEKDARPD